MNSPFVRAVARDISNRGNGSPSHSIEAAYRLLFQRSPTSAERRLGMEFLRGGGTPDQYAQALVSANEFLFIE